jgi:glucokinase
MTVLLGDIGGTNTRCALGREDGAITEVCELRNANFTSIVAVLRQYLDQVAHAERPTRGMLAIAAPMRGDRVEMLNRAWQFSIEELRQTLSLDSLRALNDFAALAWALPGLGAQDLAPIGGGVASPRSPKVVLGPGTGLGVAALVPCHDDWQAVPGEGGHVTLAARDEREEAVIRRARQRYGHCSAERLLSGPGLGFLHAALHGGPELDAVEIGRRADAGDPAALETLESFLRFLGSVAGNLALTLGAFGGVYIGGGIVPRYLEQMRRSGFRESFEAKGRYRGYLRAIPTAVITAPHPALRGLLAFDATTRPTG